MAIRDNVRQRRRERIQQIVSQAEKDIPVAALSEREKERSELPAATSDRDVRHVGTTPVATGDHGVRHVVATPAANEYRGVRPFAGTPATNVPEADPELWWKNRQREQQSRGRLSPSSPDDERSYGERLLQGFAVRLLMAALMFGACWGYLRSDLPGSRDARLWTIDAVTQDMDFAAIEAWYGDTFGGSPAFLPSFTISGVSREASAGWNRDATVRPVAGRLLQSFTVNKTGVRFAAAQGETISAVHAGRVTQVTREASGDATVLIQHPNHVMTIYGNVTDVVVKPNDWVQAGQKLGHIGSPAVGTAPAGLANDEGALYFAVMRKGETLDPAEVIPFD